MTALGFGGRRLGGLFLAVERAGQLTLNGFFGHTVAEMGDQFVGGQWLGLATIVLSTVLEPDLLPYESV